VTEDTTITPIGNALYYRTNTNVPTFGMMSVPTGDYSVSADIRRVGDGGAEPANSLACVAARLAGDLNSNYTFCIHADGWLEAGYEYFDAAGEYQFEAMIQGGFSDHIRAVTGWNTLKIVARGHQIWFVVNGQLFGTGFHAGQLTGKPAFYAVSLNGAPVEWAFTNVNVHAID
jgi:hypothetical protein